MPRVPDQVEAELLDRDPYNAADPKAINAARKKHARHERERLEVMEALLQNKKTRAWVWDLIAGCDPAGNPIVMGDTHATYFKLGEQNVGKRLLMDAVQFPELYVQMANEARNRK